jgi:hypothetical protein
MRRAMFPRTVSARIVSRLGLCAVAVVAALAASGPAGAAVTFTVNSTGDGRDANFADGRCDAVAAESGNQCTFRAAIEQANETPGTDEIRFGIGGDGVRTIRPATELPAIAEGVTIAGYSQPGSKKNTLSRGTNAIPLIELDGQNAGTVRGLEILAPDVAVRGLVVNNFDFGGIFTDAPNTKIEGNFVGTDPTGTTSRGNDFSGVSVGGLNAVVGGTAPEARNLVSGNLSDGVALHGSGARVRGNLVGTAKDGVSALPNANDGVQIINGTNNTVGGTSAGEANTVASNGGAGVEIAGSQSIANRILRNSVFQNGGLGIDLAGGIEDPSDATRNDPRDLDSGPNGLQNKPTLSSARTASGKTTVRGSLASTPKRTFTLRLFSDDAGDEGKTLLAKKTVTTNAEGNAPFAFSLGAALPAGRFVTATATGTDGTSEFSEPRQVVRR